MEVDGGGGEGSCQTSLDSSMATGLHFIDSGLQVEDVNLVAKQLLHLDDVGNREEFHRQCCEVSCCTAKEVIQIMRNQSYKVSLLQITSESFLLQDLLNPTHYDCTEELLNSWLLVQEDEDQGTATILENINKMLALVESVEHLVIFLRSILKRFGSRFLGLCASLALQALKQQRHLTSIDGNQVDDGCKRKLAQTVELISQLFHGICRRLYLSCLLTLLYVDPSDVRYFALETYFLRSTDGKAIGSVDSSVDQGVYSDLLSTVNLLRPMSLDIELDWPHLKVIAMDLLYRAGYQYDPTNNTFAFCHREPSSAKVCGNWSRFGVGVGVSDGSGFGAKILATNGEKVMAEGGAWCNISSSGGSIYVSSDLRTVAWPQSDHAVLPQNFDGFCEVMKAENQTAEKDAKVWNNGSSDACPVSLAVALSDPLPTDLMVPANDNCCNINCSSADSGTALSSDGIGTGPDDKWDAKQLWQAGSCQGQALDPPGTVSVENGGDGSVAQENLTSQETSAFPRKRSVSAEVAASAETAEPSHKLRTVGSNRFAILRRNRDKDEGENMGTEADTRHKTSDECSHSKRFLRPKDRFSRAQANVTRKTFLFKYTFPKRHQAREMGKRSASESNDRISAAKSKYTLPNGIKLKSCFIRLNRIESEGGEEQEASEDGKMASEEMKLENGVKEEPVALPEELFIETNPMKEEVTEEKVVQCVCDGCGEVVPDCSWLTAHIVTCTGRPDCGNNDDSAVTDEELAGSFQPDAPIWDPMENRESGSENTIVIVPTTDSSCVNGNLGSMLSIESGSDIASFTPQNSSEVDPANLMNLLQNQDNTSSSSSSFIYETTSSDNVGGLKMIQISNGDSSYSMSNQQQSVTGDVSDEQFGKGIVYNGVYMYEFAEYQCNMCLLAFTSQTAAAEHVQSSDHGHSTISRNSFCCCLKCSIRYREKHIMWLHSQYTCGNVADELTDESRFYRCLLCCKAFLSSAFLRRHVYLQHGRDLGLGSFVAAQRQLVETVTDEIGVVPQLAAQSCSQLALNSVPPVVPRLADYRVGLNGSLIGSWYQVNDGNNQMEGQMLEDQPVSVFPMQSQDAVEAPDPSSFSQAKTAERNATVAQDAVSAATSGESGSADSQALLDLACSIVLGGCSSPPANFTDSSVPVSTSHSTTVAGAAATAATPAASVSSSKSTPSNQSRRTAKGIMYKNVFMQCIVNYLCSTCKKDLSTKASKKEHKSSSCFDADSKRFTYLRQYSYLCPYCSEKFPSQKFCRQHQLSVCLQLMGVKTDELNHKQLLCPFCDRKYFNIITLKGHMTLIHKVNKIDSSQILGSSGLLDELISYAPDGLSEKAKDAKRKVKDENERRTMEENGSLPPKDVTVVKKPVTPVKPNVPADRKSEMNSSAEAADEEKAVSVKEVSEDNSSGAWANQNPGRSRSGVENGVNVDDSGQECSPKDIAICDIKDDANTENMDIKEELDQNDLHIDAEEEEEEEEDDLIFDADASNDFTSTDELSDIDEEMSCKADDSVLVKAEVHESHFSKTEEMAEGKKSSLKRRKSKKTRKKVATKSGRRLH